ncbi:MAG: hypothetical protein M1370_01875, partial [Bacteroidetes bacterium]|nr:hypothetical protein [Bacteroidota bacterium]
CRTISEWCASDRNVSSERHHLYRWRVILREAKHLMLASGNLTPKPPLRMRRGRQRRLAAARGRG